MIRFHFGLSTADASAAIAKHNTLKTDLDGWNAWGEAPGADVNDADTLHMQYDTIRPLSMAEFIRSTFNLVPMGGPDHQAGTLIVATTPEDWSETYPEFTVGGPREEN